MSKEKQDIWERAGKPKIVESSAASASYAPKPCPFCGSLTLAPVEGSTFRWVKIECHDCGASCGEVRRGVTDEDSARAAFYEWNRRA